MYIIIRAIRAKSVEMCTSAKIGPTMNLLCMHVQTCIYIYMLSLEQDEIYIIYYYEGRTDVSH